MSDPRLFIQNRAEIDGVVIAKAERLYARWLAGGLGGEVMPEDAHPPLPSGSEDLALYFTLGMTLNYQRNSYSLWKACTSTYHDPTTRWVFDVNSVQSATFKSLAEALGRYRVALQPNKHPEIWRRNAEGLVKHYRGSVGELFRTNDYDLQKIRDALVLRKSDFPYLCGPKISNYWLYVMSSYMEWPIVNREALTIAPDTHVIAASARLGLVGFGEADGTKLALLVASRWKHVLSGSRLQPIDMHTPLWLWSRAGFPRLD
jgi:hypothetical protein